MNPLTITLVLTAVVLNTAAQFVLKAGAHKLAQLSSAGWLQILLGAAFSPHILGGLALYVASFGLWIAVLAKLDVSVAYPMLSLGYVLAAVIAYFWLGEPVTMNKAIGIALVVAGVYFLARTPQVQ
ncbi:MAG: EamA family transporter [Burkholderiales bacterium]|nr:EamA family transporter [Burkholderiales bacterium]